MILDLQLARRQAEDELWRHRQGGACNDYYGSRCTLCAFWEGYLRCIQDMVKLTGSVWPQAKDLPKERTITPEKLTTPRAITFED
jgi:hypothetical protein